MFLLAKESMRPHDVASVQATYMNCGRAVRGWRKRDSSPSPGRAWGELVVHPGRIQVTQQNPVHVPRRAVSFSSSSSFSSFFSFFSGLFLIGSALAEPGTDRFALNCGVARSCRRSSYRFAFNTGVARSSYRVAFNTGVARSTRRCVLLDVALNQKIPNSCLRFSRRFSLNLGMARSRRRS